MGPIRGNCEEGCDWAGGRAQRNGVADLPDVCSTPRAAHLCQHPLPQRLLARAGVRQVHLASNVMGCDVAPSRCTAPRSPRSFSATAAALHRPTDLKERHSGCRQAVGARVEARSHHHHLCMGVRAPVAQKVEHSATGVDLSFFLSWGHVRLRVPAARCAWAAGKRQEGEGGAAGPGWRMASVRPRRAWPSVSLSPASRHPGWRL